MIGIDYKRKLVFYGYTKEKDHEQKNGKIRKKTFKYEGAMTQERYAKDILSLVKQRKEEVEASGGQFIFQENNDGSHGTRSEENIALYRKVEMELEFIENWPAHSPDLNLIELVWRILKSRVKLHRSITSRQLRAAIKEEWEKITLEEINECILGSPRGKPDARGVKKGKPSMQDRVQQCYDRNGYSTEF